VLRENIDWDDVQLALGLAMVFGFLYLLTYSGIPHNPDAYVYLDNAQAVLENRWDLVDRHGWLYSVLLAPFYGLSRLLPGLGGIQAAALLNIPLTASTVGLLYMVLGEVEQDRRLRLVTALFYGLGTMAWPYSHYLFREPLAAMLLLLALWSAIRFWHKPSVLALLGFAGSFGAALLTKRVAIAFLPFFAVLIVIPVARGWLDSAHGQGIQHRMAGALERMPISTDDRPLVPVAFWLVLFLVPLFAVVLVAARLPWLSSLVPTYQRYLLERGPNLVNFIALWISPGWGLLAFVPVLLIAVIGLFPLARRYPAIAFVTWGGSIAFVLSATPHPYWWGNWAFGPRQLLLLIPLLCLSLPAGLRWLQEQLGVWGNVLVAGLFLLSVAAQLIGILVPFDRYVREYLFPINVTGPDVAWNPALWPLGNMVRFARPEILDVAWLLGREDSSLQIHWPAVAPLLLMVALAGVVLSYLMRRPRGRGRSLGVAAVILGMVLWLPTAVLATRSVYLDERYEPDLGYVTAAETIRQNRQPGDLLVTDLWTDNLTGPMNAMLNYCRGQCPPRLDLIRETILDREENWQIDRLDNLAGHQRAWLVLTRVMEGDPNSVVERWLGQVGYLEGCEWTGPQVRLCRYVLTEGQPLLDEATDARFGEGLLLNHAGVFGGTAESEGAGTVMPGDTLQIELIWEALAAINGDYAVSVQLLGPDGALSVAADRRPGNGFSPTNSWQPGESIVDRYSLAIPATSPPGAYELFVLVYDPQTGKRLPVHQAGEDQQDRLSIGEFELGIEAIP
jgi:hypothetical protein